MIDIKCGNCIDLLDTISDGSVDLILTDPPYNISIKNNTTGEELNINSNLNTGEMLIVDCRKETRSIIKKCYYCSTIL